MRLASELWEERVRVVARAFRIDLRNRPSPKFAPENVQAAVVMKRITPVSNRWLAERLDLGHPTSMDPLLHRFRQHGEAEQRAFKAILSRFAV